MPTTCATARSALRTLSDLIERPEKPALTRAASRIGKRAATTYLSPVAWKQLQLIAIEEGTTVEALLREGLNHVFAARSLTRLA